MRCDACGFVLKSEEQTQKPALTDGEVSNPFTGGEWLVPRSKVSNFIPEMFKPMDGRVIVLTDDILQSGNERHRSLIDKLRARFRFGRYHCLMIDGGGVFNGRRVIQLPSFEIKTSMADYITSKLKLIDFSSQRKNQKQDPAIEGERAQLRSAAMCIMRVARECRPDALGPVSILSRHVTIAKVEDLVECSRIVAHLRATKDPGLRFTPIHPSNACPAVVADGAQHRAGELHSQAGLLIAVTAKRLKTREAATFNIVAARSGKVERVCASSLAVEVYAMVGAVACGEWIQLCYGEMSNSWFRPEWAKVRISEWDTTDFEKPCRANLDGTFIFRNNANDGLCENLAISDAKSFYDALIGEARGKEPRVAVAVAEIKQGMAALSIQPRWIPHNVMIVDGMTKELSCRNLLPLLNCMRDGTYQMRSEKGEKTYSEDLKAAGKILARLKGKPMSEE